MESGLESRRLTRSKPKWGIVEAGLLDALREEHLVLIHPTTPTFPPHPIPWSLSSMSLEKFLLICRLYTWARTHVSRVSVSIMRNFSSSNSSLITGHKCWYWQKRCYSKRVQEIRFNNVWPPPIVQEDMGGRDDEKALLQMNGIKFLTLNVATIIIMNWNLLVNMDSTDYFSWLFILLFKLLFRCTISQWTYWLLGYKTMQYSIVFSNRILCIINQISSIYSFHHWLFICFTLTSSRRQYKAEGNFIWILVKGIGHKQFFKV